MCLGPTHTQVYNERFELRTFEEATDVLQLAVWDYDTLTAHDFLGRCMHRDVCVCVCVCVLSLIHI